MERRFEAAAHSVAQSRRFALEAIGDVDQSAREAIVLMVSELATNSVVHAHSGFVVRIERNGAEIRITVADEGKGTPIVREPDTRQPHGRGLQVVRELSDTWGTIAATDENGTAVWFSIDSSAPGSEWGGRADTRFRPAATRQGAVADSGPRP